MPINLGPTTTIKQIANAAYADAKGRQGDTNQLSLHIAPGHRQLSFYPPVQLVAGGAPADVREELTAAIQAELCTTVGWSKSPGYARVHAEEILRHVLGDGPIAPTLKQLLDLCTKTRDIATFLDKSVNSKDAQEIWANANVRSAASKGTYKSLADLEPWHRGVHVLEHLHAVDQLRRQPDGRATKLWEDLQAVVKYFGLDKLVFQGSEDIKRYLPETEGRLVSTPVLQYAVLEFAEEALNTGQPAFNVNRIARLLPLLSEHACQPAFICARGYAILKNEIIKLGRDQTRAWRDQMERKLNILGRNSHRFEVFSRSPLSRVPALRDHVSVEFQITMFERLADRFDSSSCTDKSLMYCDVMKDLEAREKSVPDASLSVRLQSTLAELVASDDPQLKPKWESAAADVTAAFSSQIDHIYAKADVIAKLHEVLLSRAGNGELAQPVSLKLAVLQKNASRMEAFLRSSVSRLPQFYDVDRALLIPWWAAVKFMFADQEHEAVSEPHVVVHTADVPVEDPVESSPPVQEAGSQVGTEAPPALPISTAGVSSGLTSVPDSARASQEPQPSEPMPMIDTPAAPTEREIKQAADGPSPHTPQAIQAAPQVYLRPAQLLPSANPLRTDRPPTGKERARRNSRSDHHDSSKARWLSADVRRYRAAQADLAAIPESKA